MAETTPNGAPQPRSAGQQAAIHFDSANVKNSYANACNVSSTREEIVLNFGLNQAWEHPQPDMQVQLTNRIILSPYTAKRLALLLSAVVQQYESRFGVLDIGAGQPQATPAPSAPPVEMKPHIVK